MERPMSENSKPEINPDVDGEGTPWCNFEYCPQFRGLVTPEPPTCKLRGPGYHLSPNDLCLETVRRMAAKNTCLCKQLAEAKKQSERRRQWILKAFKIGKSQGQARGAGNSGEGEK